MAGERGERLEPRAARVLVGAADGGLRSELSKQLSAHGLIPVAADSGANVLSMLYPMPRALVLDWTLPDVSGAELLEQVRTRSPNLLVLVLASARTDADFATLSYLGATAAVPRTEAPSVVTLLSRLLKDPKSAARQTARCDAVLAAKMNAAGKVVDAQVSNLSTRGAFFRTRQAPPEGTRVRVRIELPGGRVIETDGEARHANGSGVGVCFDPLPDETRAALAQHIERSLAAFAAHAAPPRASAPPAGRASAPPARVSSVPPSRVPSMPPSRVPSMPPSRVPSMPPSRVPSMPPSRVPSAPPSRVPSAPPGRAGSVPPSRGPSAPPLSRAPSTPPPSTSWPGGGGGGAPAAGRATPEPGSLEAIFLEQLEDLRRDDYFGVLGVRRTAPPAEIRKAYLALAKRWHPGSFGLDSPNVRSLVSEIFMVIKKAYDTLSNPSQRSAYEARLAQGSAPRRSRPPGS